MKKDNQLAGILVPIIIVAVLPFISQDRYIMLVYMWFCVYCMLAVSLRFIMLVDAVNFAHAGFMGIGAYIFAALSTRLGMSFWSTFLIAGMASAAIGVLFGLVTLRLRGPYFFLVSFALCEIVRIFFSNYLVKVFGGMGGIIGIPAPNPLFGIEFKPGGLALFYLVAVISICSQLLLYKLERSYLGSVFKGISESVELAQSVGINILKYKLLAFTLGCFIAGIGGALYATFNGLITPDDFTYELSLFVLVCVILGGREHVFGAILGVAVLVIIGETLRVAQYFEPIIWGFAIIVVMLFAPRGILGLKTLVLSKRQKSEG